MADDYTISIDRTGNGQVICNGENLPNVVSFKVEGGVNQMTQITLNMIDVNVDMSLEGLETANPSNGREH